MRKPAIKLSIGMLALLLAGPAASISDGKTAQGESYVTGGIGASELDDLEKRRHGFSLRVLTAAKGSGAYLADAVIRIIDGAGKTVLDTTADGPWLYVKLNPGDYKVTATYKTQVRQQATKIRANDRHEIFFYFDEAIERLPKGEKS